MFDTIKKVAFTGMGVAALTREKVEELSKELIVKGKLTEQEGEKFVQEMLVKAEESKVAIKEQTEKIVASAMDKVPLVKADDVQQLRDEIIALRKDLEEMKKQNATTD
ncbi:phasin family protein [Desulforhopalus sp. 52FAK]